MSWVKKPFGWHPEPAKGKMRCRAKCKEPGHALAGPGAAQCVGFVNHDRRGVKSTPHECPCGGWTA